MTGFVDRPSVGFFPLLVADSLGLGRQGDVAGLGKARSVCGGGGGWVGAAERDRDGGRA